MIMGLVADALIRRGYNPGRTRQAFICFGLLGCCAFIVPAVLVREPFLFQLFLILSLVCMGSFSSNHWALTQRLSGVEAAAKWTGFQNCIGTFAGVLANFLGGVTLAATHSFVPSFGLTVLAMLGGVFGYWFLIRTPEPVNWDKAGNPQKSLAYTFHRH
jgi:MFS-type transporter involved in bile tolerance (Atg22 family)